MGDAGAELRLASGRRCLVSFDAVYHAGGAWYWSRGWGVGQATEADGTLDGVALRRGLPIMPPGADAVRHPRPYVDHEASVEDAMRRKILARYDNTRRRDCTYGNNGRGAYYDCRTCLERFHVDKLTGTGEYGKGGVFVPMGKDIVGSTKQASTFFVDLERLTPFARGALPEEDPLVAQQRYERFFGVEPPPTGEHVPKVLRLMDGKRKLSTAIKSVARAASVDKAELARQVDAHLEARTQVPCSWLRNVSEATSSGATEDERSSRLFLGATWASAASKTFNVAEAGSLAVHRAYSDKGGVRCVKPAGPLPPCKPPA